MQREKRDSIVRHGGATTTNGIVPFGGAVATKILRLLAVATIPQNARYDKLCQARAATVGRAINSGRFMFPFFVTYIIIVLY